MTSMGKIFYKSIFSSYVLLLKTEVGCKFYVVVLPWVEALAALPQFFFMPLPAVLQKDRLLTLSFFIFHHFQPFTHFFTLEYSGSFSFCFYFLSQLLDLCHNRFYFFFDTLKKKNACFGLISTLLFLVTFFYFKNKFFWNIIDL